MNFTQKILAWYDANRRELPWRGSQNPYHIWLSEVILQQTQIVQGTAYYLKFVETYPTVFVLAAADERDVLLLWQGLGYYSRARNLHFSAKYIVQNLGGVFPKSYRELLKLKGVGDYTAAAIASLAYNEVQPAIDGNVQRVIARVFGISEPVNAPLGMKLIREKSENLISHTHAADYNQAMMDFGATHCTPKNPKCSECPFSADCVAFTTDTVAKLPVKIKAKPKTDLYISYLVILFKNSVILKKRTDGIWLNMFELPNITEETDLSSEDVVSALKSNFGMTENSEIIDLKIEVKHVLSHLNLHIRFFEYKAISEADFQKFSSISESISCTLENVNQYPKPVVLENFFAKNCLI